MAFNDAKFWPKIGMQELIALFQGVSQVLRNRQSESECKVQRCTYMFSRCCCLFLLLISILRGSVVTNAVCSRARVLGDGCRSRYDTVSHE